MVQHMGVKIVSSSGYSVFRCVPFLIKMALGGSAGRKITKKNVPSSVMTQKRSITRAASISSFSPPGEPISVFFRPKESTEKWMPFVLYAFCVSLPQKKQTIHVMISKFWKKGGKETRLFVL